MKNEFYIITGARLKELREEKKYSQEYVANTLHVTQTAYGKYELAQRPIPFHHASRLSDLYNISLDYIAGKID